jgi:hypothetical protein
VEKEFVSRGQTGPASLPDCQKSERGVPCSAIAEWLEPTCTSMTQGNRATSGLLQAVRNTALSTRTTQTTDPSLTKSHAARRGLGAETRFRKMIRGECKTKSEWIAQCGVVDILACREVGAADAAGQSGYNTR